MIKQQKILVVEDNDFVRMQIVRYLGDAGFSTLEAKDGNEALKNIGSGASLALVDIRMEPMGGLDFVRALRGENNMVPVIFMTGDQSSDLLEQASRWGVDAVLLKPVMKDRLVKAVQRSLAIQGRAS